MIFPLKWNRRFRGKCTNCRWKVPNVELRLRFFILWMMNSGNREKTAGSVARGIMKTKIKNRLRSILVGWMDDGRWTGDAIQRVSNRRRLALSSVQRNIQFTEHYTSLEQNTRRENPSKALLLGYWQRDANQGTCTIPDAKLRLSTPCTRNEFLLFSFLFPNKFDET